VASSKPSSRQNLYEIAKPEHPQAVSKIEVASSSNAINKDTPKEKEADVNNKQAWRDKKFMPESCDFHNLIASKIYLSLESRMQLCTFYYS
jgi:hypothetical protein